MNSKQKGNTFERKIANLLSARFKEKTTIEQSFRRNPSSGSFFGASNQKRMQTHNLEHAEFGDIMSPSDFRYSIECKHYKAPPSVSSIVKQSCKEWDLWISQAEQDAKNAKKEIAIIIKYNNVDEIVILDKLYEDIKGVINYKNYFVVSLDAFLKLTDNHFFS